MSTIPLALYLWRRIRQLGIESIFGVPGDFNLNFLDYIYEVPGLSWVGNANELNAAYAADGYARVRGTPGCLVTTHGVGELSALNGVAGSMSEHIPIIHVVGQTGRVLQENHLMIHHSIGTRPDHQMYNKASKGMRCAEAELWDPQKAPAEIDRVLRECVVQKLPVYIFFPIDLTKEMVPEALLDKELDLSLPVDKENETAALDAVMSTLREARNASVLVDFLVHSHGRAETARVVDALRLPTYVAHMAKGLVHENHPSYAGVYNGNVSLPGVADAMESSDVVLAIGWWPADSNTAAFSRNLPAEKRVDVMDTYVTVKGTRYDNVYMAPFLTKLEAVIKDASLPAGKMPSLPQASSTDATPNQNSMMETISQKYIWPRLGHFLREGDVLLADTGTASYGLPSCPLPPGAMFVSQTYYGSIGWATPATLGVDIALRELHAADPSKPRRRAILITGDGSIQLTIQEVGTMINRKLQPILVVINNDGYTIERAIHGARYGYNDIAPYNYRQMLSLFGGELRTDGSKRNFRAARTIGEFEAAWAEDGIKVPTEVQVFEVFMDKLDIPWQLAKLLINRIEGIEKYYEEEGFTYAR